MTGRKPNKRLSVAGRKPASKAKARARRDAALQGVAPPAPVAPRFYYKGNRYKQLRAFCYAARLGTLSRAASSARRVASKRWCSSARKASAPGARISA